MAHSSTAAARCDLGTCHGGGRTPVAHRMRGGRRKGRLVADRAELHNTCLGLERAGQSTCLLGRVGRVAESRDPVGEYCFVMEPPGGSTDDRADRRPRRWLRLLKLLFRVAGAGAGDLGDLEDGAAGAARVCGAPVLARAGGLWLAVSWPALLYLAGLAPCCVFWHRTLWAMGQRPTWRESMRAFWIGHLGKYVPGKAMVVILRTGLVYSERVNRTVAATSVFIETLTMMAVGAFVAAVILLLTSDHVVLTWLAVGLMLLSGVPTYPPMFRRVVRWLQVHRANPQIDEAMAGVDCRLMAFGWLIISVGWVVLGISLWATLRAIPGAEPDWLESLRELPLLTAAVGLAMVAGFLSLIPGGLGVRDWILMTLLAPAVRRQDGGRIGGAVANRVAAVGVGRFGYPIRGCASRPSSDHVKPA